MALTATSSRLTVVSPAPRAVWHELAAANPLTVPSQTPAWTDAICTLGRWQDASRLYELDGGRRFVLPMVRRSGRSGSLASEYSMAPTWGTGGLLGAEPATAEDVRAVVEDLALRPTLQTTLRPDFVQAALWAEPAAQHGALVLPVTHHVLDLVPDFEVMWRGFAKKKRESINKAERVGVTVASDTTGAAIDVFYEIYDGWLERRARQRGIPLPLARLQGHRNEPRERLELLSKLFGEHFRIWTARVDGEPAAAMITLVQGEVCHAWRGASNKELAARTSANDVIHRYSIDFAASRGCRYYNMGESGGVESLMKFKERFGATPRRFAGYRFERLPLTPASRRLHEVKGRAERTVMELSSRSSKRSS
jgi:CelD/BcsL family acetyltransferase involved in cellulose biosynthesis